MPQSESKGDRTTKERVLSSAAELFARKGYRDTTVQDICSQADANVAAVNYYFSSKEHMLEQAAKRFEHGFNEVMCLLDGEGVPAEERLRRWASEVMRFLAEYPGFLSLMERQMTAEPLDPFGKALRTAMRRALKELTATLGEIVGTGDPQRLAFKLTLLTSALAGPFPSHSERLPGRRGLRTPSRRDRFLDLLLEHIRQ